MRGHCRPVCAVAGRRNSGRIALARRLIRRRVVIHDGAPGGAVEVVVLAALERPQKSDEAEEPERERHGYEKDQDFHGRLARSAFAVTSKDEPDMAIAATSGVARPAIAIGTAMALYTTASQRFSRISRFALGASRSASPTGASASPRNTASAAACDRCTALIGESDTSAAASAGASLRPSPTISTLRPARLSASTWAIFAAGVTCACQVSMPRSRAIGATA